MRVAQSAVSGSKVGLPYTYPPYNVLNPLQPATKEEPPSSKSKVLTAPNTIPVLTLQDGPNLKPAPTLSGVLANLGQGNVNLESNIDLTNGKRLVEYSSSPNDIFALKKA